MHQIVGTQGYGKTMDESGSNTGQTWEKSCTAWYPDSSRGRAPGSEVKSPKFLILSYGEADASCQAGRRTGEHTACDRLPPVYTWIGGVPKDQ